MIISNATFWISTGLSIIQYFLRDPVLIESPIISRGLLVTSGYFSLLTSAARTHSLWYFWGQRTWKYQNIIPCLLGPCCSCHTKNPPRLHRTAWAPRGFLWPGGSALGACQASLELSVCVHMVLAPEREAFLSSSLHTPLSGLGWIFSRRDRKDAFPAGQSSSPTSGCGLASVDLMRRLVTGHQYQGYVVIFTVTSEA